MMVLQRHSCEVVQLPYIRVAQAFTDMPDILNNASPYFLRREVLDPAV